MKTTLRRATTAVLAAAALMAGALGLAAPASAASLCSTDCISYAPVTADTKTIRASVVTTGYVNVTAEVWKADRSARVSYMYDDQAETWTNSWTFTSYSGAALKQNTYYAVKITAKDMLGKVWTEWRSIRVKQRTASYFITRIDLIDDGDYAGAGEFNGSWKVNSTLKTPIWSSWQSKSSGGNWTFTSSNASTKMTRVGEVSNPTVWLQLSEDDGGDHIGDSCHSIFYSTFVTASTSCGDWAHAGTQLLLPEVSGTRTFTLAPAKTAPTQWKVSGYVVTTVS